MRQSMDFTVIHKFIHILFSGSHHTYDDTTWMLRASQMVCVCVCESVCPFVQFIRFHLVRILYVLARFDKFRVAEIFLIISKSHTRCVRATQEFVCAAAVATAAAALNYIIFV